MDASCQRPHSCYIATSTYHTYPEMQHIAQFTTFPLLYLSSLLLSLHLPVVQPIKYGRIIASPLLYDHQLGLTERMRPRGNPTTRVYDNVTRLLQLGGNGSWRRPDLLPRRCANTWLVLHYHVSIGMACNVMECLTLSYHCGVSAARHRILDCE
jgi:hypothetical protein